MTEPTLFSDETRRLMLADRQPGGISLREARERLRAHLDEGTTCPCCDRFAKRYRRTLNRTMVASVRWVAERSGDAREWVRFSDDAPRVLVKTNQVGTTALWGLVERRPPEDGAKRTSGVYRITPLGLAFIRGQEPVPEAAYVYNQAADGFAEERVYVWDVLNDFDYAELMRG